MVADRIRNKNWNVSKIFFYNPLEKRIKWSYHVAPLIFMTDKTGRLQPKIVDLSFIPENFSNPEDWVQMFNPTYKTVEVDIASAKQYMPPSLYGFTEKGFSDAILDTKEVLKEHSVILEERSHEAELECAVLPLVA